MHLFLTFRKKGLKTNCQHIYLIIITIDQNERTPCWIFDEYLNVLGDKGWELIGRDEHMYFFKRPKP